MNKLCLALATGLLLSVPALAANQCYSPDEMHAEQLLRLHSELMVATVTCRQSSTGNNLVPYYTGFTRINIQALHNAEKTMEHHYSKIYGGDGVDRLDKLRTKLANEFGQEIADISAAEFCTLRRDRVIAFYNASAVQLNAEVQRLTETARPYESLCPASGTHIARKGE